MDDMEAGSDVTLITYLRMWRMWENTKVHISMQLLRVEIFSFPLLLLGLVIYKIWYRKHVQPSSIIHKSTVYLVNELENMSKTL